jgi:predicted AlkP superfamily pyrophosphatase or phosphodiesterase
VNKLNDDIQSQKKSPIRFDSPNGVEATVQAAEYALREMKLGQNNATDLLALSFSSHDYVGHAYGPNSPEIEQITLAEDRAISQLLNGLRKTIPKGLKETVIVLTGDHGVAPNPEWAQANKLTAGRIYDKEIGQALSEYLNQQFGKPSSGEWVIAVEELNFYLNQSAIQSKQIDRAMIESKAKSFIAQYSGISTIFSLSDFMNKKIPAGILEKQILNTYFPGRSGDIILIPKPYFISSDRKNPIIANHLTGYNYDRMVPILFCGLNIKAGIYSTHAEVIDIAPTLTFLAGTLPPNLSQGRILSEILPNR